MKIEGIAHLSSKCSSVLNVKVVGVVELSMSLRMSGKVQLPIRCSSLVNVVLFNCS